MEVVHTSDNSELSAELSLDKLYAELQEFIDHSLVGIDPKVKKEIKRFYQKICLVAQFSNKEFSKEHERMVSLLYQYLTLKNMKHFVVSLHKKRVVQKFLGETGNPAFQVAIEMKNEKWLKKKMETICLLFPVISEENEELNEGSKDKYLYKLKINSKRKNQQPSAQDVQQAINQKIKEIQKISNEAENRSKEESSSCPANLGKSALKIWISPESQETDQSSQINGAIKQQSKTTEQNTKMFASKIIALTKILLPSWVRK